MTRRTTSAIALLPVLVLAVFQLARPDVSAAKTTQAAPPRGGSTIVTPGRLGGSLRAGPVPCIGDGVSGDRVQAVYAHAADVPDRLAAMASYFSGWAGGTDQVFSDSATATGGVRHVRFVTDASCNLDIADVTLSTTGDDNFGATRAELAAQGYNRPDRKYLVWVDANVYCGIAHFEWDDRPTQDNINNTTADYARVDAGCWGSVEPHELMHTLGAVQWSAPHATGYGHCTDGPDIMCYQDAPSVVMLPQTCKKTDAQLFDCNHDDYYNTNPPAGSYLDTHWNVANSAFLDAAIGSAPIKGKGH